MSLLFESTPGLTHEETFLRGAKKCSRPSPPEALRQPYDAAAAPGIRWFCRIGVRLCKPSECTKSICKCQHHVQKIQEINIAVHALSVSMLSPESFPLPLILHAAFPAHASHNLQCIDAVPFANFSRLSSADRFVNRTG